MERSEGTISPELSRNTGQRSYQHKQAHELADQRRFEIIMRRYEVRSTLMTSNRPLEEWGKLIGDVPAATAILDRFLHHANLIKIKGKSYRMKEAAQTTID